MAQIRKSWAKALHLNGGSEPIIGVLPPAFETVQKGVDVWSVSSPDAPYAGGRNNTWFTGIGRLKRGVSLATAQANLATVQADLGNRFPATDKDLRASIEPLKESKVGGVKRSLWLLFGSVTLLLLIACTNVAALLLSRAAGRQHEVAVRFSLGASRSAVAGQWLTEVLVLALAGAVLGLVVATGASRAFAALAKDLPRVQEIGLDWRLVVYTLASAAVVTLLCGLWPAIRGTRANLAARLAQSGRSQIGRKMPLQLALVSVQVALAVALLGPMPVRARAQLPGVGPCFARVRSVSHPDFPDQRELGRDGRSESRTCPRQQFSRRIANRSRRRSRHHCL